MCTHVYCQQRLKRRKSRPDRCNWVKRHHLPRSIVREATQPFLRDNSLLDSRPRVVDLFAGAGLFSLAFKQVGFRVIRAVELDRFAAATYEKNLGSHIETADVSKVTPRGECDVLVAGPPCQGFSTLGSRREDDPRNALSLCVVKWAKALNPGIVVIENVEAFLSSTAWGKVERRLRALDYTVDTFVLDAVDYGCPQTRRRSFTIAHRSSSPLRKPRRVKGIGCVREAWQGLSSKPNGKNHHVAPLPSPIALARMQCIPPGGDKRDVMRVAAHLTPPSWWGVPNQVTDAWGRMEWSKPSNTLRTCLQNASKGRYIHPTQNRVISLREAARLHSIPDEFEFVGCPLHIARQIGNSVPPALGRAVARQVFRLL